MQVSLDPYEPFIPECADDQFVGRWYLDRTPDAAWAARFRRYVGPRFAAAVLHDDVIELRAGWEPEATDRVVREAVRLANGG